MLATVIINNNPFDPASRTVKTYTRRRRIATLAPKTHLPFIAILNGEALLRANNGWDRTLKDGDILGFVVRPQGGGGSNPLRAILSIALSLAAPGIGLALAGALGVAGSTILGISAASLLSGLVSVVGSMVLNALLPNSTPNQVRQGNIGSPSPTYTIEGQGNSARLQEPIPVQYGRHIAYPDFIADPYTEYSGNEQYLYQLLCLGQGEFNIEVVRVEDTPIENFPEVTMQIVTPGQQVTLFPSNVVTSAEVNGQELLTNTAVGPFVASAAGTQANFLGFDIVCPKGLFYANDAGNFTAKSVSFSFYAREIDLTGAPIGSFFTLGSEVITAATNTAQRRTYRYAVGAGRYEVRAMRTDTKDTSNRAGHDVLWASTRAYLPGQQFYGDLTLIALRLRATNSLSAQASRRINVISTRKLPVWNGTAWSAPQVTRNPAWAMADVLRSNYGGKSSDKRIDLAALLALSTIYNGRGDNFDARFDTHSTIFEALSTIGEAARTKPYQQGGVWHFWRDAPQTLPVAMFNMRNIAKGSVKAQYLSPTDDTADAIDLEYFDGIRWQWDMVPCKLPDSSATKVAKMRLFGITTRAQAYREGMYKCAANRYRRNLITLNTEMEGFIPTYGDLVAVQHDRPRWGQFGDVVAYDSGTRTITSSEPLDFSAGGNHYVRLKRRNGSPTSSLLATAGATAYQIVLAATPPMTPYTGVLEEKTSFTFGPSDRLDKLCLVRTVRPRSLETVELSLVLEDAAVHTADTGTPTASSQWGLITQITKPVLNDLRVTHSGTPESPVLDLTWAASTSATSYKVDLSIDNLTWQRIAETSDTSYRVPVPVGNVYLRVAPIGKVQGDYASTGVIIAGQIAPPQAPYPALSEPFIGASFKVDWPKVPRAVSTRLEISVGGVLKRTVNTQLNQYEYTAEDALNDGGPWRTITITAYSVGASTVSDGRAITATNPQIASPAGVSATALPSAITISATLPADSDYAGMIIHGSTSSGFIPGPANFIFKGSSNSHTIAGLAAGSPFYYRVAFYDLFGSDNLNFSSEVSATPLATSGVQIVSTLPAAGTQNGEVVSLSTDLKLYRWNQSTSAWVTWTDGSDILASSVTAGKLSVSNLSAITANLGSITAGNFTLDTAGFIKGGASNYSAGIGFWMGYDTTAYKFFLGDPSGNYIRWDGTNLTINGGVSVDYAAVTGTKPPADADATVSTLQSGVTVTGGGITLGTNATIKGGQTAYATGAGFFLGYHSTTYKFSIGDTTNFLRWDGATLSVGGSIIATGNIIAGAVSSISNAYTEGALSITNGTVAQTAPAITTTGQKVMITVSGFVQTVAYRISVNRNGTPIATIPPTFNMNSGPFSFNITDTPSAGTYTYTLVVAAVSGAGGNIYNRSINVVELKR
jgi:hypothetical protein